MKCKNNLMINDKKLLTDIKIGAIVHLTINIKNLFYIVLFLARKVKKSTKNYKVIIIGGKENGKNE